MNPITTFGPFLLDRSRKQLLENGKPVQLGVRALDVLTYLADRPGSIVTKEELIAGVWTKVVVDECNLRTQIAVLRRCLGDGQAGARYVMTVPGQGYCFVAPIGTGGAEPEPAPSGKTLSVSSTVPVPLVRPVGRTELVKQIVSRLESGRFISVVGPGGIGKTTTAIAVSNAATDLFPDGICFFDISSYSEASVLEEAFLASSSSFLKLDDAQTRDAVFRHLSNKKLLVVLDGCESAVEPSAHLAEDLLRSGARIKIVTTTREPLRAEGEAVIRLPALELPPEDGDLTAAAVQLYSSVQLFVERAVASSGEFDMRDTDAQVVADICRKLDGMPLAIELAAGGVGTFGLGGVAERLDERFRLSMRGRRTAIPRHQTLSAMMDWSYDTLSPPERRLLNALSVFARTFTIEAASFVAGEFGAGELNEIFAELVAKSLLHADFSSSSESYHLLATTRVYGNEKLIVSGRAHEASRRHAQYFLSRYADTKGKLPTPGHDIDELRAALKWCFSDDGDKMLGVDLTISTLPIWLRQSLNTDCHRNAQQALGYLDRTHPRGRHYEIRLLAALATTDVANASEESVFETWSRVLALAEEEDDVEYQMRGLWGQWSYLYRRCKIMEALQAGDRLRLLAERIGDTSVALISERMKGMALFFMGRPAEAREHLEEALLYQGASSDASEVFRFQFDQGVATRSALALVLWCQGFPDMAREEAQRAVEDAVRSGHGMSVSLALERRCAIFILRGDFDDARSDITSLRQQATRNGFELWVLLADCLEALLFLSRGDAESCLAILQGPAGRLAEGGIRIRFVAWRARVAEALGRVGRRKESLEIIAELLQEVRERELLHFMPELLCLKGQILELSPDQTDHSAADAAFEEALRWARQQGVLSFELRAACGLARLRRHSSGAIGAYELLRVSYSKFTEGFLTTDLVNAKSLLSELAAT